jgi:uncharacterized repeat protein (TIGR03943 family)
VREVGANGLLIAPILFALMVPAPSLGALAVKNKRTKHAPAPIDAPIDGEIRLYEIAWAADSAKYAKTSKLDAGTPVDFIGFVSRKLGAGQIELSRFFVSCCAADATAYSVKVTPTTDAGTSPADTWVSVKGTLAGRPGYTLTVAASAIKKVATPENPYN